MIYKFFKPSPHLQEYVKTYLLLHFNFEGLDIPPNYKYTPRPEQCLTFNPKGLLTAVNLQTQEVVRRSAYYLSGQQITCWDLHFDTDYLMLKIVFQPGALYRLLEIPLKVFEDVYINADSVLPPQEMQRVNEQLANTESYAQMITVVEKYLEGKIKNVKKESHSMDVIAGLITENPTYFSLDYFARQAFLSPRQFERKFVERVGITPRLFQRIARFHQAFEMKEQNPNIDWLSVAIQSGYTDFQHLVKDFKTFSSYKPTILLDNAAHSVEKVLKLV